MKFTRRQFLGSTAAAVIVAGMKAQGTVIGANNRIRICTIGFNGQGGSHIKDILALPKDAEYVALCDVDANVREKGRKLVEAAQGKAPRLYQDLRDAMQDKEIDAITIAMPNHWHSLAAIWGCQAGKDVYVEKPFSHNIYEGRQLVAAAQQHNRIVQHGTQSRCNATLIRDMKLMHDGFIGKIVESRGYVYKNGNRGPIGHGQPGPVPENLDWNLWQGPAKERAFLLNADRKKPGLFVHYDWHYFWEYGNGEIGNQGVHEMDIACWGHNRGLPLRVHSAGGRFGLDDDGVTPNSQATTFSYADGSIMTFQVRNLGSFEEADGGNCGNSFFGTKGYYVRSKGFFSYKENKGGGREQIPIPADTPPASKADKWHRWFAAIRSRRPADLPMQPVEAHQSAAHIHIANAAFREGRSLEFDPRTEQFKDAAVNRYLTREYRKGFEVPKLA
ncbi:MAG: Gfo/Idh/MocA family oxidoreductase [Opitutus sp.]|nr:Gfo/Idh/MocA family oxidoreductase [Opitutus sp.]